VVLTPRWICAHRHSVPRYPRLDDQAIFWKVIRASKNPQVLPIGKCRNFNSADDLANLFRHHGHDHARNLVSCVLDTCVFSSGMISNVYEPELTYGEQRCCVLSVSCARVSGHTVCTLRASLLLQAHHRARLFAHAFSGPLHNQHANGVFPL
jgi:hypothetical protein